MSYGIIKAMPERIGYARVSSRDQNLDSQRDMLTAAGCTKIFVDTASGAKAARPGWDDLMAYVRPGDTIVVVELSRMTRSLAHLQQLVQIFAERKLGIVSLREHLDTTTATGRAFVFLMGVINQLELELRAERTESGRAAAKARGRTGGRPKKDSALLEKAKILYESSDFSAGEVCRTVGVSPRTFFRYLAERKKPLENVSQGEPQETRPAGSEMRGGEKGSEKSSAKKSGARGVNHKDLAG
jgi:DNA invertase Pin-like site-specific DNA recombinase